MLKLGMQDTSQANSMRFIHCADLQLGKPFGSFDEDTRAALKASKARCPALYCQVRRGTQGRVGAHRGGHFLMPRPRHRVWSGARLMSWARSLRLHGSGCPATTIPLSQLTSGERIDRDKPDNVIPCHQGGTHRLEGYRSHSSGSSIRPESRLRSDRMDGPRRHGRAD